MNCEKRFIQLKIIKEDVVGAAAGGKLRVSLPWRKRRKVRAEN